VILIDLETCRGCGVCVEACPAGAIYLVSGQPTVNQEDCTACGACAEACPHGAIALVGAQEPRTVEHAGVPAPRREPVVIQVKAPGMPVPWRSRILPAVGAALAWAGREIVPRLPDLLIDRIRHPQVTTSGDAGSGRAGRGDAGGRRHRHRGGTEGRPNRS
jgi:ferredoxin